MRENHVSVENEKETSYKDNALKFLSGTYLIKDNFSKITKNCQPFIHLYIYSNHDAI